jgi:hypothetical protein
MPELLTLASAAVARDLSVLAARALRLDDAGSMRVIAESGVLAAYVAVIAPKGLLDRSPTVLGLRTLAAPAGTVDAVVPLRSLQHRVDARLEQVTDDSAVVDLMLPTPVHSVSWAAISPPRGGWQQMAPVDAATLRRTAVDGIAEVAAAVPDNPGQALVDRVRTEVWGRPIDGHDHLPAGAAFAAESLGFLGDADEAESEHEVQQFASGTWLRLTTRRGHVLVKPVAWSL